LGEALDSNEASDVTSDVISAKRYKSRYALRLEVLHFRDTSSEASGSFVTSLVSRGHRSWHQWITSPAESQLGLYVWSKRVTEHSHASVGMRCANGWRRRSLVHGVLLIPETL